MGYLTDIEIALIHRYIAAGRYDLIALLLAAAWA